jgi:hypothetical protein
VAAHPTSYDIEWCVKREATYIRHRRVAILFFPKVDSGVDIFPLEL